MRSISLYYYIILHFAFASFIRNETREETQEKKQIRKQTHVNQLNTQALRKKQNNSQTIRILWSGDMFRLFYLSFQFSSGFQHASSLIVDSSFSWSATRHVCARGVESSKPRRRSPTMNSLEEHFFRCSFRFDSFGNRNFTESPSVNLWLFHS